MRYIVLLFLLAVSSTIFCQTELKRVNPQLIPQPQAYTLQQQYKNLKSDLEIINGFRVVKIFTMDRLWAGVEDSLVIQRSKLSESLKIIDGQKKDLERLANSLAAIEKQQGDLTARVDSIAVLGIPFSKGGFVTTVSIIFLALLIMMALLLFFTRVSNRTTQELRKLNDSLYQEFDTYKRHAVEKEVKILRELQDYRNKLAELRMA
jgi:hypothetical protein